jgi:DNA polymerase I-like protein with 3'-5' exonuclease and polymerase domains/intein/homing endonuclease
MGVFNEVISRLPKPNYEYITDEETANRALCEIDKYPIIYVDTECTSLNPYDANMSLMQLGVDGKAFVFDVRHDTEHSSLHKDVFKPLLLNKTKLKVLQNAVFDMKLIKTTMGIYVSNIYDTMLVEQLLGLGVSSRGYSLKDLVLKYLGLHMDKEPQNTFMDYNQVFVDYQKEYAASDVIVLPEIMNAQLSEITKHSFEEVCQLEFDFTKALCEMELNGITMDVDKWTKIMSDVEKDKERTGSIISEILNACEDQTTLFGVSLINIDSNAQLKKSLLKYGLDIESTDVGELSKHAGIPVIDMILEYRKSQKLISTYGEPLIAKINPKTGRLHTDFKQMVSTGRMSSSNPNLQNIPKKQKFRSCFVAKEGYSLITSDMSGAELRILGNMSGDPIFVDSYAHGIDIHTRTAAEINGISMSQVTPDMRSAAKAINFGLCTTEDTAVITETGIKSITNATIGELIAHDVGEDRIIDKQYMGEKEVFEIKTKYGYTLEVTNDHPIKVIDKDGNYVDKKLKDVDKSNDQVCIKLGSNVFSNNDFIFKDFSIEKNTSYKDFILPKTLDINWASFLGLFVSEGSVFKVKNRSNYGVVSFGFSKSSTEFVDKINLLFNKLFGDRVSKPADKYARYIINSVLFSEWLVDMCNIRNIDKTSSIGIPDCIKEAPKEKQIEFLRWLFEGDGTVKINGKGFKISYSSRSNKLIKDLQLMLLNFGILSSITEETRKDHEGVYYCLSIISKDSSDVFLNSIGFLTSEKNNKCISSVLYNTSSYFVGKHPDRLNNILKNNVVSSRLKNRFYKKTLVDNVGSVYLEELSLYDDFFNFIHNSGIVPLPITSIKSVGIKKVYDLSVENHQYFLANGFVIHNCYGLSKYGLARRLKISEKKAEEMIDLYFDKYRGVKKYLDKAAVDSVRDGFSRTISGRKRFYNIPDWEDPDRKRIVAGIKRKGMNAGIQGSNADTIKKSMILLVDRLEQSGYDAKLCLTVHDEVVVEVKEEQKYEVAKIVSQSLIDGFGAYFNLIPMEADSLIGPCWLKGACESKVDGNKCGGTEMISVPDEKYGTKIICKKCGNAI